MQPLGASLEEEAIERRCLRAGLCQERARWCAETAARCSRAILDRDATARPKAAWFVPGRIEALGKHTDYCGGRSLTCATERGMVAVAAKVAEPELRILDTADGSYGQFSFSEEQGPLPAGWGAYPAAAARRFGRDFGALQSGVQIAFLSDLPRCAGLSSSSALIVACGLAIRWACGLDAHPQFAKHLASPLEFAGYLAAVENGKAFGPFPECGGVGTLGGCEDHVALLASEVGRLKQYSYVPARLEKTIALPREWTFAVAASGVAAEKTGNARDPYNRASLAASALLAAWNESEGRSDRSLAAALGSGPAAKERLRSLAKGSWQGEYSAGAMILRLEHFLLESETLVAAGSDFLELGFVDLFAAIANASQAAGATMLQNQVPETEFLAAAAQELGAPGATAFGAGFGGSVWALVNTDQARTFVESWRHRYLEEFPQHAASATFFVTRPGPSAFALHQSDEERT